MCNDLLIVVFEDFDFDVVVFDWCDDVVDFRCCVDYWFFEI